MLWAVFFPCTYWLLRWGLGGFLTSAAQTALLATIPLLKISYTAQDSFEMHCY